MIALHLLPALFLLLAGGLLLGPLRVHAAQAAVRLAAAALLGAGLVVAAPLVGGRGDLAGAVLGLIVLLAGLAALGTLGPQADPRSPPGFAGGLLVASAGLLALARAGRVEALLFGLPLACWGLHRALREASWGEPRALERALGSGIAGLGLVVIGVGCLLALTGSPQLASPAWAGAPGRAHWLPGVGVALIGLGLTCPLASFPLHGWLAEVCETTPAGVGLWICVAFPAAAVGALGGCLLGLGPLADGFDPRQVLAPLGVVTTTLALLVALRGGGLKRTLAYLAMAQGGTLLLALAYLAPDARALGAAVLLPTVAALLTNAAGFSLAVALEEERPRGGLGQLVGLARRAPGLAAMLGIVLASHAGLPLTAGFWARLQLLLAGVTAPVWPSYLVLAAFDLALAAAVALRVGRLLLHDPHAEARPLLPSAGTHLLCGVLTAFVLLLGLRPGGVLLGVAP